MWKYRELLPVKEDENIVTLGEGMTPLHNLEKVTRKLGLGEVYVKDDGIIPTGSFKARGLSMAVSRAKELGIERVAMPSAGNAAGALSAYGAKAGMEVVVAMPQDAPVSCALESYLFGANVYLVQGLISDAGSIINEGKETYGWFDVSTTKEPYRVEGKKTMGLELAEQFNWQLPDAIIYPTGGGTGIIGMWKAFQEMSEMGWIEGDLPKMVVVQSRGCAPLVEAFKANRRHSTGWDDPHTMAGGIRVPQAFGDFLVMDAVYESDGCAVSVSDGQMLSSAKELYSEGVEVCPEGAATLAGLKELTEEGEFSEQDRVLLYNTGTGIKYTQEYQENLEVDLPVIESANEIDL